MPTTLLCSLIATTDVGQLIRDAEMVLEYPMVDKDPLARWTFGRVTLAGDIPVDVYGRHSRTVRGDASSYSAVVAPVPLAS